MSESDESYYDRNAMRPKGAPPLPRGEVKRDDETVTGFTLRRIEAAAHRRGWDEALGAAANILEHDPNNCWDWTDAERQRATEYADELRSLPYSFPESK